MSPFREDRRLDSPAAIEQYLFDELPPMSSTVMTRHGAGVRRAAHLVSELGDPQEDLHVVHVAGTAGKGSVCAFLSAVLEAHGHSVGLYLSPHAHSVLERFGLADAVDGWQRLGAALEDVRTIERRARWAADEGASMFEVSTAAAFELFRREQVDYAVIETGLGGLHDATNVVRRADKLALLTSIGLDHTDVLGDTMEDIAAQKAGILPWSGHAIAVSSGSAADFAFRAEARHRSTVIDIHSPEDLATNVPSSARLGLPGPHQRINAGLALRAASTLAGRDGWVFDPVVAAAGLARASLPGRFERRRVGGHTLVLDGAHNPMKMSALADAIQAEFPHSRPVWVLAVRGDKDLAGILELLGRRAQLILATEFDAPGAAPADEVAALATSLNIPHVEAHPHLAQALDHARSISRSGDPIVVTGSFHTVATAGVVAPT